MVGYIFRKGLHPQGHLALLGPCDTGYKDDFSTLVQWWDIAGTPELFPNYSTLA